MNDNKMSEIKYKKFLKSKTFISILMLVFVIVGVTLALTDNFSISNGIYSYDTACFDVVYDAGGTIGGNSATLFPSSIPLGGLSDSVEIGINPDCNVKAFGNLYLTVNTGSSTKFVETVNAHCENGYTLETKNIYTDESSCVANTGYTWVSNGTALKYAVYNSSSQVVSVGYINQIGEAINIYDSFSLSTPEVYSIYVWLDGELVDNTYTNLSFMGEVNAKVEQVNLNNYVTVKFDSQGGYINASTYTTSGSYTYTADSDGEYVLEVWGAQGGAASSISGGFGGYSSGTVNLTSGTSLYVVVGGKGADGVASSYSTGGYNGGGGGDKSTYPVAAGGGATHIAKVSGLLSTLSSNTDDILIVAGGGAGVSYYTSTYKTLTIGHAGGYIGVEATGKSTTATGTASGGTQSGAGTNGTVFGSFGTGATGSGNSQSGGGGGYYGGNSSTYCGGGGSGYIGNSLLTDKAMYCYGCTTSDSVDTLTYATTNVSSDPISSYAKSGDGAVRIYKKYFYETVLPGFEYENLPIPNKDGYNFVGWNTKSDGTGDFVTDVGTIDSNSDYTLYAVWE